MIRNLNYFMWLFFIVFLILLIPTYTDSYHQTTVEEILKEKRKHLLFVHQNNTLIPKYAEHFAKFLSYNKGLLSIIFEESIFNDSQVTDATLLIQDEIGNLHKNVNLKGIHFKDSGSLILASSSYKFPSLITIPLFAFNNSTFQKSLTLITQILEQQIKQLQNDVSKNKKVQILDDNDNDHCEFVVYLQLLPIHNNKEPKLREIEKDLQIPNGLPYSLVPPIILSGIIMSPDCKFSLDFNNITGIKKEKYYSDINKITFWQSLLIIIQIYLLIKQMNETSTPSSISRISFWSIWIQASLDGYTCIIFLSTSISHNSIFLSSITASFLSFTLVAIFGMRYLLIIHRIQQPENRVTTVRGNHNETNEETIPLNQQEYTNQSETTRAQQNEYDNRNSISTIYTQFYLFLLIVVSIFPQIMLLPVNKRKYHFHSAWGTFGWLWLQVCILASQDFLGPRFFIPSSFLHSTYDYHPILSEDIETPSSYFDSNGHTVCSICIQNISLPRISKKSTARSASIVLGRRTYMVTPCKHLFHTSCLEKWMRIRLICPVCRHSLPPI
ncbi:hypothetical protein PORY_001906 [Pneumocystis oryctolagi]|uniref:Uncharacterized protein n=1 Tax=Pneumocystis oryctolagi TaxID=42067 RepID=A0ACB7CD43_9ASCO|nr:hypothetical protein PORY_001906 [Pneumocystis oryctolagi]